MGRRVYIVVGFVVLLLLGGAVGAYAWDQSQEDEIAEGIRIGDVDVGGMSANEARAAVRADLIKPLDKPVTVTYSGTRYILNPEDLQISADLDGMVDEALEAGREESLPNRLWRYATGGEVDETIQPTVSYSHEAIDAFVAKAAAAINQNPVDASIEPAAASLNRVPGEPGRTLHTDELKSSVEEAVQSPQNRTVQAQVDEVQPEVSTKDLAAKYPTYVTVDRANFTLRLWKNLKVAKSYPIAVGQVGLETPAGTYTINDKQVNPYWHVPDSDWAGDLAGEVIPPGPDNPLQARWMGFFDGAGIHGTNDPASLGTAASHGCIRMAIPDVIELYDQVPLGTPIYVG
jgi:lipoprotein-anchoring transpeptidase ErfK/SrfK